MDALSPAARLAKSSFDRFCAVLDKQLIDLQICSWLLQMAYECKDKFHICAFRNSFVCQAYNLALWGGLEMRLSDITPLVRHGVSSECRDDFVVNTIQCLYHSIELLPSEEPIPYSDDGF